MSIDAVALLRGRSSELPSGLLVKLLDDGVLAFTLAKYGADTDALGAMLRERLGAAIDAHGDPRGVFVFPDVAEPRSVTYDGVIAEIGAGGVWVKVVPAGYVPKAYAGAPTGSANAVIGDMLRAIGPALRKKMQAAVESGNPAALAALEEELMQSLGGEEKAAALQHDLSAALEKERPAYEAEMNARLGRVPSASRASTKKKKAPRT